MPMLNEDAFERTKRVVHHVEDRYLDPTKEGKRRVRFNNGNRFRHGFLDEDLTAPSTTLSSTTANVRRFVRAADVLEDQNEIFEIRNFDETFTAEEGHYVKCEFIEGGWEIYWVGCEPVYLILKDENGEELQDQDGEYLLE